MLKQTPTEKLQARHSAALEILAAIWLSLKNTIGANKHELVSLYIRIKFCNEKANLWLTEDAINFETGELYTAAGNYWSCGSKLCPNCLAKHAQRTRKKLRSAIAKQELFRGERYSFATFTIVNPGVSLLQTREIVNRAWTLFRKRRLCVALIRGGAKSEEFTLTANGYHYHLHCIFLSKFLLFDEVRRVWTECVAKAFAEANVPFKVETKDGMLFVKILPLKDLEKGVQEVAKYITKSDSWAKMKPEHLAEIALVRRWFRMFEMFGSFGKDEQEITEAKNDLAMKSHIVHTRNLSDGGSSPSPRYWRDLCVEIGAESYAKLLQHEIESTLQIRREQIRLRWPHANILEGEKLFD